jgi:hypothetical protein
MFHYRPQNDEVSEPQLRAMSCHRQGQREPPRNRLIKIPRCSELRPGRTRYEPAAVSHVRRKMSRTDAGASSKQAVRPYIWSLVFGLALVLTVLRRSQAAGPDCRRAERRRRGGRKRVAFRQPSSDHGAVDPDICRQAHLGPKL